MTKWRFVDIQWEYPREWIKNNMGSIMNLVEKIVSLPERENDSLYWHDCLYQRVSTIARTFNLECGLTSGNPGMYLAKNGKHIVRIFQGGYNRQRITDPTTW